MQGQVRQLQMWQPLWAPMKCTTEDLQRYLVWAIVKRRQEGFASPIAMLALRRCMQAIRDRSA
jgi:hypothetical protein